MASLSEEWSEDKPVNPRPNKRSHTEEKEADVANQKRDRGQSWPSPGSILRAITNTERPKTSGLFLKVCSLDHDFKHFLVILIG
jgi:hypothetical protein